LPCSEEPLEDQPRVALRRLGGRRGTPGKVELVGAGVPRVAGPGPGHGIAGQLQRGETGQVADPPRDRLVDGDAGADVGGALVQTHAGQERAVAAGVVAGTVPAGVGRLVVEAAEDLDELPARLQRLERAAPAEIGAFAGGPPGG